MIIKKTYEGSEPVQGWKELIARFGARKNGKIRAN
jgi:hypothetical protein